MTITAPDYDNFAKSFTAYIVEKPVHDLAHLGEHEDLGAAFCITTDPEANGADTNGQIEFISGLNTPFSLKHDQYLVFIDLPVGTGYTVTEAEDHLYLPSAIVTYNGVQSGSESSDINTALEIPSASNKVLKKPLYTGVAANSVDFINTRIEHISTGFDLTALPYIGLLVLALGALVVYTIQKSLTRRKQY
jgi:hypothetical protein